MSSDILIAIKFLKFFIICILLTTGCSADRRQSTTSSDTDFDAFCDAFMKLVALPNYEQLNGEQRQSRLLTIFDGKVATVSNAFIAWDAIQYADAKERYQLFTEAASSSGVENWQCNAMKMHAHEVGVD